MPEYVIHKCSRTPYPESYVGPTWDNAGIRHLRRDTYRDKREAKRIAAMLSEANPVGFTVSLKPEAA